MILLDTTILVYAVGSDHPLAELCRALVRMIGDGAVHATTTVEVLQEYAHVRARRTRPEEAANTTRDFETLLAPTVELLIEDLHGGLELFVRHDGLGVFDGVLAACAKRVGASALVSADKAFQDVDGLRVLDPADDEFLDQVSRSRVD